MKWILAALLRLPAALASGAEPVHALLDTREHDWSFFVRPEVKFTTLTDEDTQLAGGLLGAALGRTLYLGLGGYGLINSVETEDGAVRLRAFDFWYAGAHADYTLFSAALFHGSLSGFIGGGQARNAGRAGDDSTAGLFVAEPGVNLEFNLTSTLELGLGAGYRFVNGSDLDRLSDDDFSGWTATLFLRWTES